MSTDEQMDKDTVTTYTHTEMSFSHDQGNPVICNNTDELEEHYAK